MNEWMDGWMDACMDGWMDGWMDKQRIAHVNLSKQARPFGANTYICRLL